VIGGAPYITVFVPLQGDVVARLVCDSDADQLALACDLAHRDLAHEVLIALLTLVERLEDAA
jgi:hypothetical protein